MKSTLPFPTVKREARVQFHAARWWHQPVLPCTAFPAGMAGLLLIEREPGQANVYLATPQLDGGQLVGWRLTKPDGAVYDVAIEPTPLRPWATHLRCDCPDHQFNGSRRPCRHIRALNAVLREVTDTSKPRWRSAAEAAEHGDISDFDPAA